MHPYVKLAKDTIETYVRTRKMPTLPKPLPPEFQIKSAVFVSLKKHGELRGCIGSFLPAYENIAQEIMHNAIASATKDPRFSPVKPDELKDIEYSVDVLSAPELVKDIAELDAKKYGVIVSKGLLRGLLLPDLEGVSSVEHQLQIAKMKAGISPFDTDVIIHKFTVQRYK